ncbi:hypothetical protein B0188_11360 [[Haemophilus] felis]|uniref:Uncharacterized protein n=1 Tax=[Haemophilus] felis TaxID=123822 RepID=A0A1T0ARU7_9PAST|nr:hypothetical protein B0188_11360 [[Haemophilus] felis]
MQRIYILIILTLVVFLGYKGHENLRENNKKGICLYTNSFLTKDELYKRTVYFYVRKSIDESEDYYNNCYRKKKNVEFII